MGEDWDAENMNNFNMGGYDQGDSDDEEEEEVEGHGHGGHEHVHGAGCNHDHDDHGALGHDEQQPKKASLDDLDADAEETNQQ